MAELFGAGKRRWEPAGGLQKHNEKIRKESKQADQKNLPFTFSKPVRRTCHDYFECDGCGSIMSLPRNTIMVVCSGCKELRKVTKLDE